MTLTTLGYAFLGGLLPSLIWLYFLLKEDSRCPEPRTLIALTFVAGMVAVPFALPLLLVLPLLTYVFYRPEITRSVEASQWAGKELQRMGSILRVEIVLADGVHCRRRRIKRRRQSGMSNRTRENSQSRRP